MSQTFRKLHRQDKVTLEFSTELQLTLIFGRQGAVRVLSLPFTQTHPTHLGPVIIIIIILCLFPSVLELRLNYMNGVNTRMYNIMNTYILRIHIVTLYYMVV